VRVGHFEIAVLTAALCSAAGMASAQLAGQAVPALDKVGIEEHLDATLPLDLEFLDEDGRTVRLRDYFDGVRPVILTLNYYRCPMLCGLQLNGVVAGMEELDWTPGVEFEMVTVSIDPLETPELAKAKKENYLKRYQRPAAARGWHFLTGRQVNIERLAETVGFGYTYDTVSGQYAHAAAIFVITPDGRVARYLYGIEYPPKNLKLALMEASQGEIGSPLDQLIMYCFHYDPASRRYAPVAMNIMRVGGGATALVLGATLGMWWLRESRRRRRAAMESTQR
jgi:protein SCO1/2